ncbi:BsuPI-related putative proteinase inhibitor [Anoxybacteroides tepidamans]|uniref:BsuPI-related putative proteinase inhibitor n=1 Tax=Anoxybacteroides tepidamans TaxID=265948 RepID=UPI000483970D|nr:BsuPI-related putative proteinase inhibitor [Anoxybacillus tepidamans]
MRKKTITSLLVALIAAAVVWNFAGLSSAEKQLSQRQMHPIVAGTLQPSLTYQKQNKRYTFTFSVKNQTEREQKVTFTSGQKYDYILYRNGKKLKQFSEGKMFTQIYEERILKQGEELSFTETFPPLPKGQYTLTWWLADKNWPKAKATITFTVQ